MSAAVNTPAVATDAGTLRERADAQALVDAWVVEHAATEGLDEGALPDWLAELVELAGRDLRDKAARAGLALRRLTQQVAAIDAELKVLQARRAAREREAERLRTYLHACLDAAGETRVETPLVTVRLQANPLAVHGTLDEAALWELVREQSPFARAVPAAVQLDRRAVLDAHKAGAPIPAGLTVARSVSLRVA